MPSFTESTHSICLFHSVDKLPALFMNVNKLFSLAVHNRILPSDVIVKTVVTALGSWWYARMYRQTSTPNDNGT